MRLAVLGSGSGGNAVVVESRGSAILIDAGLSAKQLCQRLALLEIEPNSLDGILLSHEHSDHACDAEIMVPMDAFTFTFTFSFTSS